MRVEAEEEAMEAMEHIESFLSPIRSEEDMSVPQEEATEEAEGERGRRGSTPELEGAEALEGFRASSMAWSHASGKEAPELFVNCT